MAPTALRRAMTGASEPPLRPLPAPVCALLEAVSAAPRLGAHLRAVYDTAWDLTDALARHCPELEFDRTAVLFGAATHDIGKAVHATELSGPGSAHEHTGYELLLSYGVEEHLARFARTHASWTAPDVAIEDLLVSLADKVWKGRRVTELEDVVIGHLAAAAGRHAWEAFAALDDLLGRIADGADGRLAFQARHPVQA